MEAIEQLERTAVSACCLTTRDEPMSRHTTFRIGGPADLFVVAHTYEALCAILQEAGRLALPVMTIGKGSNLLVGDGGIRGCVVSLAGDFENIHLRNGNEVVAGAGTSLAGLCNFAKKWQLSGLEFAWGIPGSVGGAAFMNAGGLWRGNEGCCPHCCLRRRRRRKAAVLRERNCALRTGTVFLWMKAAFFAALRFSFGPAIQIK